MKPPTRHQLEYAGQATLAATLALCGIAVVIILIAAMARLLPRGAISIEATPAEWAESITPLPDEAPGHRIHPTYYNWKDPHNDPLDQG